MSDIVHQSLLEAAEPLGEEEYFAALEAHKADLEGDQGPFSGLRRRFDLYTHRRAAARSEYPDLRVQLRRRLIPLTAWQRVELSGDYRRVTVRTGMASPAGADANTGRILWVMAGRLFIYLLLALVPAFMLLYLLEELSLGSSLAWITLGVVAAVLVFLEALLYTAANRAKKAAFHAELRRLHHGTTRLIADALGLETAYELQIAGPGAVEPPAEALDGPPQRTKTAPPEPEEGSGG